MSVPHLDTRVVDGEASLMFGPFATFSPKFLKNGSMLDIVSQVRTHNLWPMLRVAFAGLTANTPWLNTALGIAMLLGRFIPIVFVLALVMCARHIPARPGDRGRSFLQELGIFRIPQVWMTVLLGAVGFGAFFSIYSYIATLMTEAAGGPEWAVPIALMSIGLGMVFGNVLGGRLADISVERSLLFGLCAVAVGSALVGALSAWPVALVIALFVFGVLSQLTVPSVQLRLLDVAGSYQSIGAALNHSALNIGNSVGAAFGGVVIAAGFGYAAPAWLGVVLSVAGVGIAAWSLALDRRRVGAPA